MTGTAVPTSVGALLVCALALLSVPERPRLPIVPSRPPGRQFGSSRWRRGAVAAVAVTACGVLLVPEYWPAVVAVAAGAAALVSRRPTGRSARRRAADRRLIAVQSDLLASCLDAGMAVGPALRAVSEVMLASGPIRAGPRGEDPDDDGPLAILDAVAVMLALGADTDTAWRAADLDEDLAPLAAAARRSAVAGGRLADAAREHAAVLRQADAAAELRAAGRAGVFMTAPLGLCFLPAFLCLGLAPVVIGLLGQLSIF